MPNPIPVLEIGGTHAVAALVDPETWTVTDHHSHPVDADADADSILDSWVAPAAAITAPAGARWGVAMPDPFDYATGIARFRNVGKYEALDGVDVRAALLKLVPHEPTVFVFANDADAFILGEWVAGHGVGRARCVGVTLGTGLGTGWIVDGRVTTSEPGIPPLGRARTIVLDGLSWRSSSPPGVSGAAMSPSAAIPGSTCERSPIWPGPVTGRRCAPSARAGVTSDAAWPGRCGTSGPTPSWSVGRCRRRGTCSPTASMPAWPGWAGPAGRRSASAPRPRHPRCAARPLSPVRNG